MEHHVNLFSDSYVTTCFAILSYVFKWLTSSIKVKVGILALKKHVLTPATHYDHSCLTNDRYILLTTATHKTFAKTVATQQKAL